MRATHPRPAGGSEDRSAAHHAQLAGPGWQQYGARHQTYSTTLVPAAGDSGARPGGNGATAEGWLAAGARWGHGEGAHHSKAQAWSDGMPSELSFSGAYIPQRAGAGVAAAGDGGVPVVDEARVCALEQQVQARLRALQRSTRWHTRRLLRTAWGQWRGSALEVRG